MNELATQPETLPGDALPVPCEDQLQLIAHSREQMQVAQTRLIDWFARRLEDAQLQRREASDAKTAALAGGYNAEPFTRLYKRAEKMVQFYEKALDASLAGYVLIPDLPVDVFAIRTNHVTPRKTETESRWTDRTQASEAPPVGEGRYVDSVPVEHVRRVPDVNEKGEPITHKTYFAHHFKEAIDFPLSVAKPLIMDEVTAAMQLKVFDEIGVLPKRKEIKKDPLVVGIIKRPGNPGTNPRLMFLLAWYLDTRVL